MNTKCLAASGFKRPLTTAEFAASKLVLPQTVRKRLSQTGSYFVGPAKPSDTFSGKDYGHFSTQ